MYPTPKIFKDDFGEEESSLQSYDSGRIFYAPIKKLEGYISLKNAVFGYSPLAAPLINGLDIEFTPGKRIALVGATGNGKSTIGKLISATYPLWSGELMFDGKPLSEIDRKTFAASVSVVNQSISLFEGTIKDNFAGRTAACEIKVLHGHGYLFLVKKLGDGRTGARHEIANFGEGESFPNIFGNEKYDIILAGTNGTEVEFSDPTDPNFDKSYEPTKAGV
ncbi:MAG: ATP-binding cassette domain-containing protein [Treponema sp.]|nr:ATP-binding cassette domain-containing protein [Treponema sp.]